MIHSKKQITKALIRLRECAGWSAPVLFANAQRQVFLRRGPYSVRTENSVNLDLTVPLISYHEQMKFHAPVELSMKTVSKPSDVVIFGILL